jgi:hypothetical protein
VGHNIYILCHQLAQHNKELAALLKPSENNSDPKMNQALKYYASHTSQIEVSMGTGVYNHIFVIQRSIKKDDMGGGCSMPESQKIHTKCWTESHLRNVGINGRLIKLILKEIACETMNWSWLAKDSV